MKELLLGWLLKGHYEITYLDRIIGGIEIFILLTIGIYIFTKIINKGSDK